MKGILQNLFLGTSLVLGMGAIATPVLAGSITNVTVWGSHLTYDSNGTNTYLVNNNNANWQQALDNKGNIELGGQLGSPNTANFSQSIFLTGTVDGEDVAIASLTADDWFGTGKTSTTYGSNDLANTWFNAAMSAYNINDAKLSGLPVPGYSMASLFTRFLNTSGFQRFSDPNIESVKSSAPGQLDITLAGHYNATSQLFGFLSSQEMGLLPLLTGGKAIQASEVVKVFYGGEMKYLYNFQAVASGVVDPSDGVSHTGNYLLSWNNNTQPPTPSTDVPEPSILIGLVTIGGLFASSKRKSEG